MLISWSHCFGSKMRQNYLYMYSWLYQNVVKQCKKTKKNRIVNAFHELNLSHPITYGPMVEQRDFNDNLGENCIFSTQYRKTWEAKDYLFSSLCYTKGNGKVKFCMFFQLFHSSWQKHHKSTFLMYVPMCTLV